VTLTFTPTAGTLTLTVTGTVQNAQLELGAFPTSYIPTTSATATRAADVASMTGSNFSGWYSQSEGTMLLDYSTFANVIGSVSRVFYISDGTLNNSHDVFGTLETRAVCTKAGVSQADTLGVVTNSSTRGRIVYSYAENNWAYVVKGGVATVDNSVSIPSVTQLNIFDRHDAVRKNSGHIRKLAYYPKKLSNTELQELTK